MVSLRKSLRDTERQVDEQETARLAREKEDKPVRRRAPATTTSSSITSTSLVYSRRLHPNKICLLQQFCLMIFSWVTIRPKNYFSCLDPLEDWKKFSTCKQTWCLVWLAMLQKHLIYRDRSIAKEKKNIFLYLFYVVIDLCRFRKFGKIQFLSSFIRTFKLYTILYTVFVDIIQWNIWYYTMKYLLILNQRNRRFFSFYKTLDRNLFYVTSLYYI